ncbi:cell adhesion molecule 2-like [Atheta coriaria]|uniref:cell adhesion molecule 2-like n=1 Tax=Dalotia coriaria TaxID=877792 RepID=UPI0031F368EA
MRTPKRLTDFHLFICVCNLLLQGGLVAALHLQELRIPSHAVRNSNVRLECHFELDGETLYSVKWYKDGNEFYRYVPRDMPPAQVFPLPGVTVNIHNSSDTQVVLTSVQLPSSGLYRCEVSGEAPFFQTVTEHQRMMVVALPEEEPKITGGKPRYQVGDTVRVNCTSGRSKPAAQLSWFINGEHADPNFLRGPDTIVTGREGLETSILGLEFAVRPKHFKKGDMKLKCLATIATLYFRSNEESVEGERPQRASVLESRGTVAPPGSRADRVQAATGGSTLSSPPATAAGIVLYGCLLLLLTGMLTCPR